MIKRIIRITIKSSAFLVVICIIGITFIPSVFGFVLFRSENYKTFNEQHKSIDTYIFEKRRTSKNDNTFELIVYFPSEKLFRYLTIVPADELIGLADQADENIWVLPGAKIAYMFPSGSYFTPLNGPYFNELNEYQFSKDVIRFNTFGDLKKFGKYFLVQKDNPPDI